MYELKVLLNRSNAPKGNFNSCNDFLQIVIDASFLCAALHFFNMNDLSAPPSINGPSASVLEGSHITRCKYFNNTIANIVDTYVLPQNNDNAEQDGVPLLCFLMDYLLDAYMMPQKKEMGKDVIILEVSFIAFS